MYYGISEWLSTYSILLTQVAVAVATAVGVLFAIKEWRHHTAHWLYIARPKLPVEGTYPLDTEFIVLPPVLLDAIAAVIFAGRVRNAGPNDAMSVGVSASGTLTKIQGRPILADEEEDCLLRIVSWRAACEHCAGQNKLPARLQTRAVMEMTRRMYSDLARRSLRGGEDVILRVDADPLDFAIIACYQSNNRRLAMFRNGRWVSDGRQIHPITVTSHTVTGRRIRFSPDDLCFPGIRRSNRIRRAFKQSDFRGATSKARTRLRSFSPGAVSRAVQCLFEQSKPEPSAALSLFNPENLFDLILANVAIEPEPPTRLRGVDMERAVRREVEMIASQLGQPFEPVLRSYVAVLWHAWAIEEPERGEWLLEALAERRMGHGSTTRKDETIESLIDDWWEDE